MTAEGVPLGDWLRALRRRSWLVLICAAVGAGAGAEYSRRQETLYAARSQVVVSPADRFLDPGATDALPRLSTTVQALALTDLVLRDAATRLTAAGFANQTPRTLRRALRVSVVGDTPVLSIEARAKSAESARSITAAETLALKQQINYPRGTTTGIIVKVFGDAAGQGQVQPRPARNIALGANVGLLAGLLLVVAFGPVAATAGAARPTLGAADGAPAAPRAAGTDTEALPRRLK